MGLLPASCSGLARVWPVSARARHVSRNGPGLLHSACFWLCPRDCSAGITWLQVGTNRLASGRIRLPYFLRVSLSCLWICSAQLVSCGLSISLGSGRFISTSLMCASSMCRAGSSYMISGWLISHSFRQVSLSKFQSFLYSIVFVLGQLP